MLDSLTITLVKESFATIVQQKCHTRLARVFYDRLFDVEPNLEPLFTRGMREQRRKFYSMLKYIIDKLDQPEILEAQIHALGIRHRHYRIKREDYATFFGAWIYTLSAALGNDFTPQVRHAWCQWCEYIGALMNEDIRNQKDEQIAKIQASLLEKDLS